MTSSLRTTKPPSLMDIPALSPIRATIDSPSTDFPPRAPRPRAFSLGHAPLLRAIIIPPHPFITSLIRRLNPQ